MQKKIIIWIILNVVVISATLGIISYLTVRESIQRSLQNRLVLSGIIGDYIEIFLQDSLSRLYDISLSGKVDLQDNNWEPEKRALESAYKYSLFTDGVFILDKHGNELISYPPRDLYLENLSYIHYVNQVLAEGKPVISNVFTIEPIKKQVIFMMVPLRDRDGSIAGVAGGMFSPTSPYISQLLQRIRLEKDRYIEIVDTNEVVVASDDPSRVLKHHDHGRMLSGMIAEGKSGIRECGHGYSVNKAGSDALDLLAFMPLKAAPWGVIVGQNERDVYAPAIKLQRKFMLLVIIFIATAIVFSIGMSKSIVKPLKALIGATNRIAGGDLTKPVGDLGRDEIRTLSRSFDDMRIRLAESLEHIRHHAEELEQRVAVRTEQIRRSQEKVERLLKKIISSQEEERKRIARGLHDEILQDMSAFLIKLDVCKLYPGDDVAEKIEEIRKIGLKTIDDMHNVIQNLRPPVLDDLGLAAAVKWLLDKRLDSREISCFLNVDGVKNRRFDPKIETTLFRIIQEAISNIARHSDARNVFVILRHDKNSVTVDIEDDGEGFDVQQVQMSEMAGGRGLGIMGMKERAALLDGRLEICSWPGMGTRMSIRVPLGVERIDNV